MPGPWLLGFIDPIEDVAYFSYRLKLIPEELRGRVLGVCRLFSYISGTLGIFLTGLSDSHSPGVLEVETAIWNRHT